MTEPRTMPALSVRQPYAAAILAGVKKVENRTWIPGLWQGWNPDRDGELPRSRHLWTALHAGQRWYDFPEVHYLRGQARADELAALEVDWRELWPASPRWSVLPLGVILGVVRWVGAVRSDDRYLAEDTWAAHEPDTWAWLIHGVYPLKTPIPYKGGLGLFQVAAPVAEQIRLELAPVLRP